MITCLPQNKVPRKRVSRLGKASLSPLKVPLNSASALETSIVYRVSSAVPEIFRLL